MRRVKSLGIGDEHHVPADAGAPRQHRTLASIRHRGLCLAHLPKHLHDGSMRRHKSVGSTFPRLCCWALSVTNSVATHRDDTGLL
jgi:hypothetical protein